jgi:acyl transferase domain-containing protein/NAD(P)-dependent dehydrogenase (short-subunit alcohol dehydrogenase family)
MSKQKEPQFSPIAVVGASGLFPGSVGGQSFWRNILGGEDFMTDVPEDHWLIDDYFDPQPGKKGKIYGKRGAFLPKVDFDPMEFGMPPKQLSTTDTAQLLGLVVANKVLEDAVSVQFGKVDKADISVILGVASATELVGQMASRIQRPHWIKALRDAGIPESKVEEVCDGIEGTYPEWDESTFPGLLGNVVAGRIANRLDLGGTNCVVDAACASSLGAVSMAIRELQSGASNLVITGGVDALNDTFMYMCFSQTPALSPTGDCRPFSADADGTMLGEGIGMLALRRLEDAERDGDRIYSVIRGVGSASDGKSGSIYAPESRGQALAIRRTYDMAGYDVDEVELIEAHGTATKAGDAAEFGGLRYAFEDKVDDTNKQWCALGSVKSQIGHTKSAAGSASLFKVVMALHHKVLPPTIKVSEPNPALKIEDSAFYLSTKTRPWVHDPATTRKGSVSSFGFGGSNFHVALEEYNSETSQRGRYHASPIELLVFSGADKAALVASAKVAVESLKTSPLPTVAASLQKDFDSTAQLRLSIMATDREAAGTLIEQASSKIEKDPTSAFSMPNKIHYGVGKSQPKVAFIFPGQGSQYVNMGSELACEFDQARSAWDIASTVDLNSEKRLDQIVHPIPVFDDASRADQQATLTSTQWAQPAIGCVSWSMLNLLDTLDLKPDAVAGHSYGEVTALYAAGALKSPESLMAVSRRRGELMFDAASTPGSMTAVRGGGDEIQAYLDSWDVKVVIANLNSPTQVVIAGETSEIEKAEVQLKSAGVTFKRLTVATAFHTDIVSPSAEPFAEFLTDIKVGKPNVPVYSNTTATTYSNKPAEIRKTLAWQLANPVRFQEMVERMHDDGIEVFLEVGPSSLLGGMVNDCLKGREFSVVSMDNKKQDGRSAFWNALGSLCASGVSLNFDALWQQFAELEALPESIKRSPVTVKMNGANHGKPYPPKNGSAGVPKPNPEVAAAPAATPASTPMPAAAAIATSAPTALAPPAPIALQQSAAPVRDANWVAAFQSLQEQTLAAQKSFQDTLGQAHQAFLHASEVAFTQLSGAPSELMPTQAIYQTPITAPVNVAAPVTAVQTAPIQAAPAQAIAPQMAAPSIDFEAMLLDVVAEKTGYPKEMLTLDMELESGLGIDSIKRVEILSTLQEEIPHLGEMDTGVLAELNTLGEIIDLANASAPAQSGAAVQLNTAAQPSSAVPAIDFEAMLLDVVAEKTGYPKEMLTLDMELESGLGIDSIKRVEILSTLQEEIPHLGDMDTGVLAELNTLGEIIDLANASAPAGSAPAAQQTQVSSIDFESMLLEVVAEKTGYPKDMLTLDMELESGLGIDSIKRVEILSTLQEQIPHLGDMDTGVLAELNTLGEIIDLANASAPAGSATTAQQPQVSSLDFEAMLLDVVAEKTGYPKDMLTLDMELESGLGIDSIKRVEILSSLQDQIPHLGDMDTGVLAELNTLGEIIELANASAPSGVQVAPTTDTGSKVSAADFERMLLEVVAEKTGYPEEMLTLDMELESGLGIDSIKRVEILSSLQDQIPHLGELDTGVLAELNTLGEIIELANASAPGAESDSETKDSPPKANAPIEMTRYEVATNERAASGIAIGNIQNASPLYLVGDKTGTAEKLADMLLSVGIASEISALSPENAEFMVVLTGLNEADTIADQSEINVEAFEQVRRSAKTMSTTGQLLVTVQSTGGDFGISGNSGNAMWATGLAALAKTASREWPNVSVKAIDVETENLSIERIAQEIFAELIAGGSEIEVGLQADGKRVTLVAESQDGFGDTTPLSDDAVIVVSGGARGVTAACLQELLERKPVKLAILGRTPLKDEDVSLVSLTTDAELKKALLAKYTSAGEKITPIELNRKVGSILNMREVRSNLAALSSTGSEVVYLPTDIADEASVNESVASARSQFGPITMIVHAAGVLADKEIHKKTDEQFQSVFKTKIDGLQNLLKATESDPLSHMVCFSSVAARTGNSGQVDYAMANDILNRVCQAEQTKRGDAFTAKSIGWGPWAGGMVDPSLAGHFRAQGVELIPMQDGANLFADEVEGKNGKCVEIVYGGGLYNADQNDGHYQLSLHVHESSYPQISSHLIQGQAVVPLVLVNEWGLGIASALYPTMSVVGVRDLNVVKGIQLEDFEGFGDWLNIECTLNNAGDLVDMVVSNGQGVIQYKLSIELSNDIAPEAERETSEALELETWEWTPKHIYEEFLFHGEKLQVIKKLIGTSEAGCRGMLQMPDEADLARFRVAMLDGGLQLALLWERKRSGLASLPTKLGHLTWDMPAKVEGPVLCDLILKKATKLASTWSIVFTDVEKKIIATMEDVNIHVLLGKA